MLDLNFLERFPMNFLSNQTEEKNKENIQYLFNGGVEPLVPAGLALLGGLANEERGDPRPLVLPIFHNRRLEDLILGVLPHASLYHYPHLDAFF